jgi:hypothetical protein
MYTLTKVNKFFKIVERNKDILDASHLHFMTNKWTQLTNIRQCIRDFDMDTGLINLRPRSEDKILCGVRARLLRPFEELYQRVKDLSKELALLRLYECHIARAVRRRLCELWRIEKLIEQFCVPSTLPSLNRSFPLLSRRLVQASLDGSSNPSMDMIERLSFTYNS